MDTTLTIAAAATPRWLTVVRSGAGPLHGRRACVGDGMMGYLASISAARFERPVKVELAAFVKVWFRVEKLWHWSFM